MSKHKSLTHQVNSIIYGQLRFGQSKHQARRDEGTKYPKGIFSHMTFETYMEQCHLFVKWLDGMIVNDELPPIREIKDAFDYLRYRNGYSFYSLFLCCNCRKMMYNIGDIDEIIIFDN